MTQYLLQKIKHDPKTKGLEYLIAKEDKKIIFSTNWVHRFAIIDNEQDAEKYTEQHREIEQKQKIGKVTRKSDRAINIIADTRKTKELEEKTGEELQKNYTAQARSIIRPYSIITPTTETEETLIKTNQLNKKITQEIHEQEKKAKQKITEQKDEITKKY